MVAKTEISEVTDSKFLYSRFAFKNFDEIARLDRAAEETFFGIMFAYFWIFCNFKIFQILTFQFCRCNWSDCCTWESSMSA